MRRRARRAVALLALGAGLVHAAGCADCHGMSYDSPTRPDTGQPHQHPNAP